jgi:hypothetical protein
MKLLTVLLLIVSIVSNTMQVNTNVTAAQPTMASDTAVITTETDTTLRLSPWESVGDIDFDQMVCEEFDDEAYCAAAEQLYTLADQGDTEALLTLYDQLHDQLNYLYTMLSLASIHYYEDVYNDDWSEAYQTYASQLLLCGDAMGYACCYVTQSTSSQAFADYVGEEFFDFYSTYEVSLDRELELSDQENELIDQYEQLITQISDGEGSFTYEGQQWDIDMINGQQGDELYETDYNTYRAILLGLLQCQADMVSPIYAQLVSIRQEIAALNGYDSYNDYAYEVIYERDYTPEDAQALCDAVKPIARAYYDLINNSDIIYATEEILPAMDAQTLLDVLGQYVTNVDDSLAEPLAYLIEHDLYNIGNDVGRYDGAFSELLIYYKSPYLFVTTGGDYYDFITLTHEFGHCSNFYFDPNRDAYDSMDIDLAEVHSNGLQALMTQWYDEIFTQGADAAEFSNLCDLMENLIDGCIMDEFQRRIYDCQEELTSETINQIYIDVSSQYTNDEPHTWDNSWLYVDHNFMSPLYYISYAASALPAIQLWDLSQTDSQAASDTYMVLVQESESYAQALEDCGLWLFTEDGSVSDICQPLLDHLEELAGTYSSAY